MPAGERKALAQRVANALGVIARYDARRMARIRRDLRAVLVWPFVMPGTAGQYLDDDAICILNPEMVEKWRAIQTAMIIVHEATHARLRHCAYVPSSAGRIEQRCKKEEIAFASRLPGSERLQQLLWKEVEAVGSREYTAAARTSRAIDHMEREGASRALLVLLRRIARLRRPHASPSDQRE